MPNVFLFGAGASREYHGVMGGFFTDLTFFRVVDYMWQHWMKNGASPELAPWHPGGPQHYDGGRWHWPDLVAILEAEFGPEFRKLGLERTFSGIEQQGGKVTDLFIRGIELALFHQWRAVDSQNVDVHFKYLRSQLRPGDTLLTFNYDPVLEVTLQHLAAAGLLRWHTADGFCVELVELGAGPSEPSLGPSQVQLLKLHGSVNWLVPAGAKPRPPYRLLRILPTSLRGQGWIVHKDEGGNPMKPVIVPPSAQKDIDAMGLRPSWDAASAALGGASSFTVVGYRLPETDAGALELLGAAAAHLPEGVPVTYVTHGDEAAIARFTALFPHAAVHRGGFRSYVDSLGPAA